MRIKMIESTNKKSELIILSFLFSVILTLIFPLQATPSHGFAIHGDLKYPADFKHFDYVNPNAPKGGLVTFGAFGSSYDTFNPFLPKGVSPSGIGSIHCTLLSPSSDEPSSSYGYLAESVDVASDRLSATFQLNPNARFSDGTPVTAEDVVFTFDILRTKGAPTYKLYYQDLAKVEALNPQTVKFTFAKDTRELPGIMGQLPILSKKFYTQHDFTKADLTIPVGCGPYKIGKFNTGRNITYTRIPNWWGAMLPSQVGQDNFDLKYLYFRDESVEFQAFQSGEFDFRLENTAKNWMTGYNFPAVKSGKVVRQEVTHHLPMGMQLFLFNLRKPLFQDLQVRRALAQVWDFNWVNKNLFYNSYVPATSFFDNSELASSGLPSPQELVILEKFKGQIPDSVLTEEYKPAQTDGSGRNRKNVEIANQMLENAGWIIKNGKRVNAKTGKPFQFTFLINDPAYERLLLALQRNLESLGIVMEIRTVTSSQYIEQMDNFDFDMTMLRYQATPSPGNEQRFYWSSKADVPSGHNYPGLKSPAIDALVEDINNADTREELVTITKALDRVLIHSYPGIYGYYSNTSRIAYWDKFGRPAVAPQDGVGFGTWWVDPEKEKKLAK